MTPPTPLLIFTRGFAFCLTQMHVGQKQSLSLSLCLCVCVCGGQVECVVETRDKSQSAQLRRTLTERYPSICWLDR